MPGKKRVAVVGGMNVDIQGTCCLPFRAGDSNPGSIEIIPGGVGRNIAENLARLGLEVQLVTALGDDDFTPLLEGACADMDIGLEGCVRLEGKPSPRYLCLLDSDGSLSGGIAAMEAIDELLPGRLEAIAPMLDSCALIIADANLPEPSIAWLATRYPRDRRGPRLGFDPVSAKKAARGRSSIAAFAFAKPNRAEAAVLAGLAGPGAYACLDGESCVPSSLSPDKLSRALRAKGLGEAFVSLGYEGIWAEGAGRERWLARLPERAPPGLEPVSSSGAGDAACAAIGWGLLEGASLGDRCALALAASMLASSSHRPVSPSLSAGRLVELSKGIKRERIS
jgi:pseudouridine kinase